jgi:hypothetical protein
MDGKRLELGTDRLLDQRADHERGECDPAGCPYCRQDREERTDGDED